MSAKSWQAWSILRKLKIRGWNPMKRTKAETRLVMVISLHLLLLIVFVYMPTSVEENGDIVFW